MKAKVIMTATALAALTLLSAGCKKHDWRPDPGTPIKFRMKSNMENPVETKKVYNNNEGRYFSIEGTKFEGIDWEVGDKLSIGYVSAESGTPIIDVAEYQISEILSSSAISGSSVVSVGKAVPSEDGQGLFWHGGNYHEFYTTTLPPGFDVYDKDSYTFEMKYDESINGYYPDTYLPYIYPYAFSASESDFMTKNEDDGSYCENMQYAYIYSINNGKMIPRFGDIELTLTPHFTAFEITVKAKAGDTIPVNSFSLSSDNIIAGKIPYVSYVNPNYDPQDPDSRSFNWKNDLTETDVSRQVTIDFSEQGIILVNDGENVNQLKFTFFTSHLAVTNATITFNINKDGNPVNRSLRLAYAPQEGDTDINWISFSGGLKHRIYGLQIPLELTSESMWFEGTNAGSYTDFPWGE